MDEAGRGCLESLAPSTSSRAVHFWTRLFGTSRSPASMMAAGAAAPLEPGDVIAASCAALVGELLGMLG